MVNTEEMFFSFLQPGEDFMTDKNMPPLIFFPILRLYFQQDFAFYNLI